MLVAVSSDRSTARPRLTPAYVAMATVATSWGIVFSLAIVLLAVPNNVNAWDKCAYGLLASWVVVIWQPIICRRVFHAASMTAQDVATFVGVVSSILLGFSAMALFME
jgi:hypothetical protein